MKPMGLAVGAVVLASSLLSTSAQTIPDQIDAILARPAVVTNAWTILIENSSGSTIYYQRNPTSGLAPASNTKIFTSSAAFGLLGTNYAFQTRIYCNGAVAGGVLTGDLNLVCEHDITWNTSVFPSNPRAPLDYIATKLKTMGITNVTGNVQCYGCCFYNLADTDASNHDAVNQLKYNSAAATNFVAALNAQGITVSGIPVGQTGFAPSGSLFYTYYSTNLTYNATPLRLDIACNPMLKVSHNVMADGLCRHLGYKLGGTDSFAAGTLQVLRWMNNFAGVATNGIVMNDGSGLSHGNRFTARETVSLVRYMIAAFPSWPTCLPIGCNSPGTLSGRFCSTDGSGKVHAKTGSLSISIALSGYIDNKYDNQRYLFSFIANVSNIDQTDTRQAIDDAVVVLGANGVPFSPQLRQVKSLPNGTSLAWSDEKFIRTGYRIYSSSDGVSFGAAVSVGSGVQSFIDTNLIPGTKRYYKVSVVGTGGESKASRIYGAQAGGAAHVLIVDGDDRWQTQTTENPSCTNHGFCAIAGQNISGPVFETANHNAVIDGTILLTNYSAVIWLLGEESTADETFSAAEQSLVTAYLNAGGNLFVSGSEIGWDLDRTGTGPTAADRDFYHNQLRAVFANDDANTYAFGALAAGIFSGNASSGFDNSTKGTYNVDFPDVLTPTNGSVANINYTGGTGGAAAIQYDGSLGGGKLVNFGFPFETITNSAVRDAYMSDILRFFGVLDPPTLKAPQWNPTNNTVTLLWNANAGLNYRVQFKTNLTDPVWQTLGADITATNTSCTRIDNTASGDVQRFYRIFLVN